MGTQRRPFQRIHLPHSITHHNSTGSSPSDDRNASRYVGIAAGLVSAFLLLCIAHILAIGFRNPERRNRRAQRRSGGPDGTPAAPYGALASEQGSARVTQWLREHREWRQQEHEQEQEMEQRRGRAQLLPAGLRTPRASSQPPTRRVAMTPPRNASRLRSIRSRSPASTSTIRQPFHRGSRTPHIAMVPLAAPGSIVRRPVPRPMPNQAVTHPVTMPTGPPPAPAMIASAAQRHAGVKHTTRRSSSSRQTTLVASERTKPPSDDQQEISSAEASVATEDIEFLQLPPPAHLSD